MTTGLPSPHVRARRRWFVVVAFAFAAVAISCGAPSTRRKTPASSPDDTAGPTPRGIVEETLAILARGDTDALLRSLAPVGEFVAKLDCNADISANAWTEMEKHQRTKAQEAGAEWMVDPPRPGTCVFSFGAILERRQGDSHLSDCGVAHPYAELDVDVVCRSAGDGVESRLALILVRFDGDWRLWYLRLGRGRGSRKVKS